MKILVLNNSHHKNKEAMRDMFIFNNVDYLYGNYNDIPNYDLIYSGDIPIDTSKYPDKKFIFGPHFSVFPDNIKLAKINNIYSNAVYIQPSEWSMQKFINMGAERFLPISFNPFPVNINKFKCINKSRTKVFIYYKRRKPEELFYIETYLKKLNIEYKIFDYCRHYEEKDYLSYLQECKYGIIIDAHESQGFAIEEALSCNVPLLVWNVRYMSQEYNSRYPNIPASSIPYFDERCGESFYNQCDFDKKYNLFMSKLDTYKPREYITENLSYEPCYKRFINLI